MSSSAFDPFDGVVSGSAEAAGGAGEIVSANEGYRTTFDSAPIGIAFVSPEGRWLRVNRALCQLVGYSEDQLLELHISSLTHPDDVEATLERERRQVQGTNADDRIEKRYVRADGTTVWVAVTSTLVRDSAGAALYSVAQIENINDRVHAQAALGEAEERFRRALEQELTRLAEHDSLTGLLNRRLFQQELERERKRTRRSHGRAAILYIDVDHFKRVNDTYGHRAGDDVLQSIARRLVLRLRATDIIARIGGDEFAVLLLDLDSIEDARSIADEIRTAVRSEPVPVADTMVRVTISIGIATLGEGEGADDRVLIAADNAMFEAKSSGRDGVSLAVA